MSAIVPIHQVSPASKLKTGIKHVYMQQQKSQSEDLSNKKSFAGPALVLQTANNSQDLRVKSAMHAPLVAQLIATQLRVPQTRRSRKEQPLSAHGSLSAHDRYAMAQEPQSIFHPRSLRVI